MGHYEEKETLEDRATALIFDPKLFHFSNLINVKMPLECLPTFKSLQPEQGKIFFRNAFFLFFFFLQLKSLIEPQRSEYYLY